MKYVESRHADHPMADPGQPAQLIVSEDEFRQMVDRPNELEAMLGADLIKRLARNHRLTNSMWTPLMQSNVGHYFLGCPIIVDRRQGERRQGDRRQ